MVEEDKHNEQEKENTGANPGIHADASRKESFFKELVSGKALSVGLILNNLGFVLFLTLLGAIYITNRFQAEKDNREINKLRREVSDFRSESIFISAELMQASRQSEVYRLVKERGLELEELKVPPYKIVK